MCLYMQYQIMCVCVCVCVCIGTGRAEERTARSESWTLASLIRLSILSSHLGS